MAEKERAKKVVPPGRLCSIGGDPIATMIWFDVTKAGRQRHSSGLRRVSNCLLRELRGAALPFDLSSTGGTCPAEARSGDWIVTAEVFDAAAPDGWGGLLRKRGPVRLAAVFHDAIPLRHPEITWPHSVARHPLYVKALARFDRVWAVSETSRRDLLELWRWQRIAAPPPVSVLALGADADGSARATVSPVLPPKAVSLSSTEAPAPPPAPSVQHPGDASAPPSASFASTTSSASARPVLLCVGILEPRKNQALLLEVAEGLWRGGLDFELHLIGRVNPHFGAPIVARIDAARRAGHPLWHHAAADDATVAALHARACATLFPTIAEGCGLPLLESLWRGVPCVCSDLPVLLENATAGGCLPLRTGDAEAWRKGLENLLVDAGLVACLRREACLRPLPTWAEAARTLIAGCV